MQGRLFARPVGSHIVASRQVEASSSKGAFLPGRHLDVDSEEKNSNLVYMRAVSDSYCFVWEEKEEIKSGAAHPALLILVPARSKSSPQLHPFA